MALPSGLTAIPSMLSHEEKQYLAWLTRETYQGMGAVVDLGPWLGSSTASLCEGLRQRGSDAMVDAIDRWSWEPNYMEQYAGAGRAPGADFHDLFLQSVGDYASQVRSTRADLSVYQWTGGPIEILFVDAAKSWDLINAILKGFGASLIPGRTRVVLQDFRFHETPWLPLIFDSRPDLWRESESVHDGCTVSFIPMRALDGPEGIDRDYHEGMFPFEVAEALIRSRVARETAPNRHYLLRTLYRQALVEASPAVAASLRAEVVTAGVRDDELEAIDDVTTELLQRSWAAYARGDAAEAQAAAERAQTGNATMRAQVHEVLGMAALAAGRPGEARRHIDAAIAGQPWSPVLALDRAMVAAAESRYLDALVDALAAAGEPSLSESHRHQALEIADQAMRALDTPRVVPGMVSAIVPVHNRAGLLAEAVDSVLRQTWTNLEVIIVDDGSTDETSDTARALATADNRVRVVQIPHQGRPGIVREAGTRVARGEFIQYLDSDDLLDPRKFELLVPQLETTGAGVAYSPVRRLLVDGSTVILDPPHAAHADRMLPAALAGRLWLTPAPIYRRSVVEAAGPWSGLRCWEDIEFDLRVAAHDPRLVRHAEPLTIVRDHDLPRLSGIPAYDDPERLAEMARAAGLMAQTLAASGVDLAAPQAAMFATEILLLGERCRAHGLHDSAAACRRVAATLGHPAAAMTPLPIAAVLRPAHAACTAAPGEVLPLEIAVDNLGVVAMRDGNFAFEVVAQVRDCDGRAIGAASREVVPGPIAPGASGSLVVPVRAPVGIGLYVVDLDVLWGATALVGGPENPLATVKLLVTSVPASGRWTLSCHDGGMADLEWPEDEPGTVRIAIRAGASAPWHVQLNRTTRRIIAGERYRIRAQIRAEAPRSVGVGVALARDPWSGLGHYADVAVHSAWQAFEWVFVAAQSADSVRLHVDAGSDAADVQVRELTLEPVELADSHAPPLVLRSGRLAMDVGVEPLSRSWGRERGLPPHRFFIEQFLVRHAADIRGRCLEFQDPTYAPRFGREAITRLDILHVDDTNPLATVVADLSRPNDIPSDTFDCIICTHVLQLIEDLAAAIRELHRILAPGGVLLVGEPHVSMASDAYGEIWRFTPHGMGLLLGRAFGAGNVEVIPYGNSLVTAGDFRGLAEHEFSPSELGTHDRPFALEVCARAVKAR